MRPTLLLTALGLSLGLGACAPDTPSTCAEAEGRFASCNLAAPSGFAASCAEAPEGAAELLTMDCSSLAAALDDLGKADVPGFDRGENTSCTFNVQCGEDFTCRPTERNGNASTCQPYGGDTETCDNKFDCVMDSPCVEGACRVKRNGGGW